MLMNRAFRAHLILFLWPLLLVTLWVGQAVAQATVPSWKILVLIYDKTDFTYIDSNGMQRHVVAELTPEQRDHAQYQARQFFEHDVPTLNSGNMSPQVAIRFPDRVLTELAASGDGYSVDPSIAAPDIEPDFDSVFVIWQPQGIDQNTGESIYLGAAGGLTWPRGASQTYAWAAFGMMGDQRNVFKHEWGHSILFYFEAAGASPQPTVSNHANAGDYVNCLTGEDYVWQDETEADPIPNSIYNNDSGFTHDYYSGTVATSDQPMRCLGVTAEAWAQGGPLSRPRLPNDDFASASGLFGDSGTTNGTNRNTTNEPGEPRHAGVGENSVWWRWKASRDGVAVFNTIGSNFDTALAVYIGNSQQADALLEIASNDDTSGLQSRVEFEVTAGTDYRIAVVGYNDDTGDITLNWRIKTVTASCSQNPNVPENVLDGDIVTRWSCRGDGQWLQYNLGSEATVTSVSIARYMGHSRQYLFDIDVSSDGLSWSRVYSGFSSGTTRDLESYDFTPVSARFVRIVGYGNTSNGWNHVTELEIGVQPETPVTASCYQGPNIPENVLDGDLDTRWSCRGEGQWLQRDLGSKETVTSVSMARYEGERRQYFFDIQVSSNGVYWSPVYTGSSSGTTLELETYDFAPVEARYVRVVGHKNSVNDWNHITELEIGAQSEPQVTASCYQDPNAPENVLDGDLDTRWSCRGDGQWLQYDQGSEAMVRSVSIARYMGHLRQYLFDIVVSSDGLSWSQVYSGFSSGTTRDLERYDLTSVEARYVRIVGYGNTTNTWNHITELQVNQGLFR